MKILTSWLRSYLPSLDVPDAQLAEDLTLRGIAVEGIFPVENSPASIFDMDITTNRVDAMNHYGIAREVAVIYNQPLPALDTTLPTPTPGAPFPVRIDEPTLCGRFTAQVIRNVTIGPSTGDMAAWFTALGQKSISNAVDATNFTLLGMGHPTHAFDLDKIDTGIIVRRAHPGEQLRLLDGTTRTLTHEDLVVADHSRALALAGVMGGWDSMITPETRKILVEAAWFDPATIRASSRRHLIHTDASHRFERGADFAAAPIANTLVTRRILADCGGTLEGPLVDIVIPAIQQATETRPPITLSVAIVHRILGTTLPDHPIDAPLIERYLTALGCTLQPEREIRHPERSEGPLYFERHGTVPGEADSNSGSYSVQLPSWRLDITREIDLIEEIARVHGYNRFANTLPTPGIQTAHPTARKLEAIRARLFQLGYSEAISSTFASAADSALFAPNSTAIPLENPLSEEAANLRPSLAPGMVAMLAHNLNRDVPTARLFEIGTVFTGSTVAVIETPRLALGLTGQLPATPIHSSTDAPFFELKGAVESLLSLFTAPKPSFNLAEPTTRFESGRAASAHLADSQIAELGQLAYTESIRRKLRQPVYLAEIHLDQLLECELRHSIAHELSRFQAVERDFSFTFPDTTAWQTISNAIHALVIPELQSVAAVEIFRDAQKLPGQFSLLIRVVFQSTDRTLVDAELATWSAAIIQTLQSLNGTLRT
jgi:phenylalanyl-tRNA synthetase beta chain